MRTLMTLALAPLVLAVGCQSQPQASYSRVWTATHEVLKKRGYFVRTSKNVGDVIVATGPMQEQAGFKGRLRIEAKVREDKDGYYEPHIHVHTMVDLSIPSALGNTSFGRDKMRTAGRSHDLESSLYNEIIQVLYGRPNRLKKPFVESQPGGSGGSDRLVPVRERPKDAY